MGRYEWFLAQAVPWMDAGVAKGLANYGEGGLSEEQQRLLISAPPGAPGQPEAFLTKAARDRALGRFGPYTQFVPISWLEAQNAGFTMADIACGHVFGELGFAWIVPPLIDAVVQQMKAEIGWAGAIVIGRTCYEIFCTPNGSINVDAHPAFGVRAGEQQMTITAHWLNGEFSRRLGISDTV